MTSIPGYCIHRGITMQKLFIFPYFYPKKQSKGAWIGLVVFRPNAQNIQHFCIINDYSDSNQILHSDKDNQILVTVGRPKICPTNPKWRTAAILKMDKLLYFSNGSTDFACWRTLSLHTLRTVKKINFKNQRWRTAAILKIVKCQTAAILKI